MKPAQGWTIHIKRSNRDAFFLGSLVIVEKVGDLKDPSHGVLAVEARHIKLKGVTVWGVMGRWGGWRRRGSVGWEVK